MADSEIAGLTEDTTPDLTDNVYVQDAAGTVDKRVPLSALPVSTAQAAGDAAAAAAAIAASQPLDSDLTAIAALTTTAYGRAFLALANAAAGRAALELGTAATAASSAFDPAGSAAAAAAASQPLDSDLTAIAALSTTSFGRSLLAAANAAALRALAELVVGTDIYSKSAVDALFAALADPLANLDVSPDTTTTPGSIMWDLNERQRAASFVLGDKAAGIDGRLRTRTWVNYATIGALPTCTYNNSLVGAGATLTATANGVIAGIDGSTNVPTAGQRILVRNQASAFQNGPYTVTDPGTAGTPFILTRIGDADEAKNYVSGVEVLVYAGDTLAGSSWFCQGVVTMGTTSLFWAKTRDTPVDGYLGGEHQTRNYESDLNNFTTAMTAAAPGTTDRLSSYVVGTAAQITALGSSDASILNLDGVAKLETGSTTTGCAFLRGGTLAMAFDQEKPANIAGRWRVPTATAATDLFVARLGIMDLAEHPLAGIWLELPQTASEVGFSSGNLHGITSQAQTIRTTQSWSRSGTVITVTSTAHGLSVGGAVVVAASTQTTPLPNSVLGSAPYIVQTVADANTFTIVGVNSGATSGTASITPYTRTITDLGTSNMVGTTYRNNGFDYNPITKTVRWFTANVYNTSTTTNIPSGSLLAAFAGIAKKGGSTGTTSLAVHFDYLAAQVHDPRGIPLHFR